MAKKRGKKRSTAKVSNMTVKSANMCMNHHHCGPRCMGVKKVLLGALVLLNVSYAWLDWASFVGWLLVLIGFVKLLMPVCRCYGR